MNWIGMRRRICCVAAVCVLLSLPATSHAWGPEGHRITGEIAEQYLDDKAKQKVRELLDGRSLAEIANWADDIRSQEEYQWTRPLHYVNLPRDAERIDMERDCENGRCVIGAIRHYADVLVDTDKSREERTEALKFIVHFIGDVHQPMHVSYEDDRGGNMIRVNFMGDMNTNLHRVWDSGILRERIDNGGAELAEEIVDMISEQNLRQWSAQMDPVHWANESFSITRRIYDELPRTGYTLDRRYYERNIDTVLERLAMSGVRMAALLNDLLGRDELAHAEDATDADHDEPEEDAERDADDAAEDDEDEEREVEDAAAKIALIEGDACGRADGRTMFIRNTHDTRTIEVILTQTWDDGTRSQSVERRFVLRPGERGQRRLGCTEQAAGARIREFSWEIAEARFRN